MSFLGMRQMDVKMMPSREITYVELNPQLLLGSVGGNQKLESWKTCFLACVVSNCFAKLGEHTYLNTSSLGP